MNCITTNFRITLVAAWLLFSVVAPGSHHSVSAFVVNGISGGKRSHSVAFPSSLQKSELFMNDLESDNKVEEPTTTTATTTALTTAINSGANASPTATSKRNDKVRKVVKDAFMILFNLQSIMWNAVGIFFTAMLFLNIFGYDFAFEKESGFRIDTVQEFRMERQMADKYATTKLNTIGGNTATAETDNTK